MRLSGPLAIFVLVLVGCNTTEGSSVSTTAYQCVASSSKVDGKVLGQGNMQIPADIGVGQKFTVFVNDKSVWIDDGMKMPARRDGDVLKWNTPRPLIVREGNAQAIGTFEGSLNLSTGRTEQSMTMIISVGAETGQGNVEVVGSCRV